MHMASARLGPLPWLLTLLLAHAWPPGWHAACMCTHAQDVVKEAEGTKPHVPDAHEARGTKPGALDSSDEDGTTNLMVAAQQGKEEMVIKLLDAGPPWMCAGMHSHWRPAWPRA